jgi:hypothetical protein
MRAVINFEFASEELETFLSNAVVRSVSKMFGDIPPDQWRELQRVLQYMFQQGMTVAMGMGGPGRQRPHHHNGPLGAPPGYPPPGYPSPFPYGGPPFGGPQPGPIPSSSPPPYGDYGPQPMQDNVRPIREPAHVERCFAIESTRHLEAGIGCCKCATYNRIERTHCRHCGHKFCVIATPPGPPQPPAQGVDAQAFLDHLFSGGGMGGGRRGPEPGAGPHPGPEPGPGAVGPEPGSEPQP